MLETSRSSRQSLKSLWWLVVETPTTSNIINHHQSSSIIINHHQSSSIIINHINHPSTSPALTWSFLEHAASRSITQHRAASRSITQHWNSHTLERCEVRERLRVPVGKLNQTYLWKQKRQRHMTNTHQHHMTGPESERHGSHHGSAMIGSSIRRSPSPITSAMSSGPRKPACLAQPGSFA